jgi:hypothetical protein
VGTFEQVEFGFTHTIELVLQVVKLQLVYVLGFNHFIFEILILALEQVHRVFVIVFDLLILGQDRLYLHIFGVDDLLQLGIFVVKGFNLIKMLLFEVLYFTVEVVVELRLDAVNLLSMLGFLVVKITPKSVLLLPELSDLEIGFLVETDKFHIEVTNFVFLLLTVLFEFSDFKFVLFVVVEM